jgi:hypothetical protein
MQKKLQQIMLFLLVYFTQPLLNCAAAEADQVGLPRLIPQRFFEHIETTEIIDGEEIHGFLDQRDCVENAARNLLALALLKPSGDIRPGVQEKILDKSPILTSCYKHSSAERISSTPELDREWLDNTTRLERFGVKYLQGTREASTGIDNFLALMEGLMPESKLSEEGNRLLKLKKLCKYLSTDTLDITLNPDERGLLNYADLKLKFKLVGSKKPYTVILYIGVGHVSIRQGSDYVY